MADAAHWRTYQDFILKIERAGDAGQYNIRVSSSGSGEASGIFALPFSPIELDELFQDIERARMTSKQGIIPESIKTFGTKLFNVVMQGMVRDVYVRAQHIAETAGQGLRIKLRLVDAPELAHLPWELLFDGRDFVVLSTDSPLVRYLDLPNAPRPMKVGLPLRVLFTLSSPSDLAPLEVEDERQRVENTLAPLVERKLVEIDFTPDGTIGSVQNQLREAQADGRPVHIWHFIGHGMYDEASGTSLLAFTDSRGKSAPVTDFQLGTLFNSYPEMRLALINACEGARSSDRDPFSGVAAALVGRGIPAVIGMQFEISDDAAIAFAAEFYAALVDGMPLDAALTEARRSIFLRASIVEWATPVLFMRVADGTLFDLGKTGKKITPAPRDPRPVSNDNIIAKKLIDGLVRAGKDAFVAVKQADEALVAIRSQMDSAMAQSTMSPPALETPKPRPTSSVPDVPINVEDLKIEEIDDEELEEVLDTVEKFPTRLDQVQFVPMPRKPGSEDKHLLEDPWRIVLELYMGKEERPLLAMDLYGDTPMGRGAGTPDRPMFNLQPYKAHEFGVSRHHATIIVTPTQMYIVDEGSTNGTAVNGDLCMPNKKVPLNSKDVLSLSKMNFMVHVVRAPEVEERTG